MSLINEALKRAEQEKRRARGSDSITLFCPAPSAPARRAEADEPVEPAAADDSPSLRGALLMGACVIVTVAAVMYFTLPPTRDDVNAQLPIRPRTDVIEPEATGLQPIPDDVLPAPAWMVPELTAAAIEAELAHIEPVPTTTAAKVEPAHVEPVPTPATAEAELAHIKPVPPTPVFDPPPASEGVVASIEPAPTAPITPPPARPEPPPLDASDFKLDGILHFGEARHAIINNHLLAHGEEINGARVVTIGKYHVVLEKDGRRLTLRM